MKAYTRRLKEYYQNKFQGGREVQRTYKDRALEFLPDSPTTVLDVGCGSGMMSRRMARMDHSVIGLDDPHARRDYAEAPNCRFLRGNLNKKLPFAENSIPVIWCCDVLEHVVDPVKLMREFHRVLLPDGQLILVVPNSGHLFYRIFYALGKLPADLQVPGHLHFFSKASVLRLGKNTGFTLKDSLGRNLYCALKQQWVSCLPVPGLEQVFRKAGLHPEYSYSDGEKLWLWSGFNRYLNSLLADALIFLFEKDSASSQRNE